MKYLQPSMANIINIVDRLMAVYSYGGNSERDLQILAYVIDGESYQKAGERFGLSRSRAAANCERLRHVFFRNYLFNLPEFQKADTEARAKMVRDFFDVKLPKSKKIMLELIEAVKGPLSAAVSQRHVHFEKTKEQKDAELLKLNTVLLWEATLDQIKEHLRNMGSDIVVYKRTRKTHKEK